MVSMTPSMVFANDGHVDSRFMELELEAFEPIAEPNDEAGKIIIPFEKKWNDENADMRPATITVSLYKYVGETFDPATAVLVETAVVKASDGWKYDFDATAETLFDENGDAY